MHRELVSTDEVSDLLLDVRMLLTAAEMATESGALVEAPVGASEMREQVTGVPPEGRRRRCALGRLAYRLGSSGGRLPLPGALGLPAAISAANSAAIGVAQPRRVGHGAGVGVQPHVEAAVVGHEREVPRRAAGGPDRVVGQDARARRCRAGTVRPARSTWRSRRSRPAGGRGARPPTWAGGWPRRPGRRSTPIARSCLRGVEPLAWMAAKRSAGSSMPTGTQHPRRGEGVAARPSRPCGCSPAS